MWHQFRALAARLGLTEQEIEAVERAGGVSLIQDPHDPRVRIKVGPDPDWTQRIGEAWNETLVNSRRESAGTIWIDDGLLEISNADSPNKSVTVKVAPGRYEVLFTVAHLGSNETYDYEEYVSHAFVLLEGNTRVAAIEPFIDDHDVELGLEACEVAFGRPGVLRRLAGDHLGRWTLRRRDLFHPKISETTKASLKSVRVGSDDLETAIMLEAGEGRGDYPLFSMTDADGNIVGILMDFFVDNRPW